MRSDEQIVHPSGNAHPCGFDLIGRAGSAKRCERRIAACGAYVLSTVPCFFQAVEQAHQFIDLDDDAVLFGERR